MPFKSHAQARKVKELVQSGKIKPQTAIKMWHDTVFKDLPDKVHNGKKTR